MNNLISLIPQSITNLVGLAIVLGALIMLGTFFQEWAKSLYRKRDGRAKNNLEESMAHLINTLNANNQEIQAFVNVWKSTAIKTEDSILNQTEVLEEIRRKQEKNWKRLFEEEIPPIKCHASLVQK